MEVRTPQSESDSASSQLCDPDELLKVDSSSVRLLRRIHGRRFWGGEDFVNHQTPYRRERLNEFGGEESAMLKGKR